ncbi:putative ribonuclease H-like domain-containing protein [Tanacetum coccineum]
MDDEDIEKIDSLMIWKEIDLKMAEWPYMLSIRVSVFYKKTEERNAELQEFQGKTRMEMLGIGQGTTPEELCTSRDLDALVIAQDGCFDFSGSELFNSVFNSHLSDGDDNQTNDRFKKDNEYHDVPPLLTGNYMPPLADLSFTGLDDSQVCAVKGMGGGVTAVKASTGCVWRPKMTDLNNVSKDNSGSWVSKRGNPQQALKNKGIFDSGCSRHMTGNKDFLTDYQDIDGGFVAFGGSARGGKITGKGKIRTDKLDFEDVFFVKELKFNLFSVSQMCDKKNSVLFTETECLVLSPDFKLLDESQVLLRVPRQSNMYSFDLKNVVPSGDLTCLFAKAIIDESKLWHRRLGHVNFKTMNKLVKGNLVRGLPSKIFENDHTCVACQKRKQHKASYKAKLVSSISQPLQMLHMDLFGPTSVRSINHKTYCLIVTDDFSRFSWVFFLASKDETSGILKRFITEIEKQLNHKVKVIRSDNGTEFKNWEMNEFCRLKRIKREFSVARTPQQNEVAERKNKTLIEVARTMLADSLLPNVFWAEAVNTACYVLNRVLVTKPHNKTLYELIIGRPPSISFMRPFRCLVTILNTLKTRSERVTCTPNNEPPLLRRSQHWKWGGSMSKKLLRIDRKVPPTPHDSPSQQEFPHLEVIEGRMKQSQPKQRVQEIGKNKEVKHLTPKKEEIQTSRSSSDEGLDEEMHPTGWREVTISTASTLTKMKEQKAKEKGVAIIDVEDSSTIVRPVRSITTLQPLPTIDPKDKGKGVLVEEEPVKIKMRDQGGDGTLCTTRKYKGKKNDTNAALAKEFDEIQARIDADHELAVRLTHEEQEKYTIKERARVLAEFLIKERNNWQQQERRYGRFAAYGEERFEDTTPEVVGVHTLLMDGTLTCFNMLVEKRYPLIKEMLQKMLNWKLEVEAESTMAFELLKFINFDQFQPPQYSVVHQPPQERSTKMLHARENLMEDIQAFLKKYDQIPPQEKSMALLQAEERFLKIKQKPPIFYDDDDEESSIPLSDIISELPLSVSITPNLPITDSLIMEDEHLNTIPKTKSDEENESSVKDLNLTLSESEDLSDNESECDMPVCDDSSSKNEGLDDIVSIPPGKEIDHLDTIPNSVQSLLNHANSIIFLIEEFTGKLAPIDPIPSGIVEADPEEDIRLIEKLLNDDSFPHSPEELNSEIPSAIIESFFPSHIPVEDSDSLMEEIDIFLSPDDSIPPGIENDCHTP